MTANPFADTSTLDFIAKTLYNGECSNAGTQPIRWLCLKADIQKRYLEKAAAVYTDWVEDERSAQVRRSGP